MNRLLYVNNTRCILFTIHFSEVYSMWKRHVSRNILYNIPGDPTTMHNRKNMLYKLSIHPIQEQDFMQNISLKYVKTMLIRNISYGASFYDQPVCKSIYHPILPKIKKDTEISRWQCPQSHLMEHVQMSIYRFSIISMSYIH